MKPPTPTPQKRDLIIVAAVLFAIIAGITAAVWIGGTPSSSTKPTTSSETQYYTAAPTISELSNEAREGCLALGMTKEQIDANNDTCLSTYWTVDKLKLSSRTWKDWLADQKVILPCTAEEYVPAEGETICELGGSGVPMLPYPHDPWWEAQKIRDPGRVTDRTAEPSDGPVFTDEDWKAAYAASLSEEPVPIDSIAVGRSIMEWCTSSNALDPSNGSPISKKAWDSREIVVDARPCLIDLFAEHHNGTNW